MVLQQFMIIPLLKEEKQKPQNNKTNKEKSTTNFPKMSLKKQKWTQVKQNKQKQKRSPTVPHYRQLVLQIIVF